MKFVRRVSKSPSELGLTLLILRTPWCPDIWEADTGDFLVIGQDVTQRVRGKLPPGVAVSPGERVILVPRRLLASAKPNIPDELGT